MTQKTSSISARSAGTVTLGGDLTVNRLGYGAMRLTGSGIWGPPKDRAEAIAVLRRAVELDVNFIDTADSYGPYVSEEIIGEALAPYREGVVVATKGGWERCGPNQWIHNASPRHLREAVEGSLRRLRLERIDVYYYHVPDPAVSLEASMDALAEMQAQGKIRHIALSNVTREHIERARRLVPIVSVQNRYSFADREWDYVLDYCTQQGIVFVPWAPMRAVPGTQEVLQSIARAHGVSELAIALAWLLGRAPNTLLIPGTSSVKHLEENVSAASLELSADEFERLSAIAPPPASLR
ncbi:MAG TPA: aldo/keto reductase [Acidobacteriaceae bacterium]|nr:aldo/keto reductase [Acidobacteriaceae bacterium]